MPSSIFSAPMAVWSIFYKIIATSFSRHIPSIEILSFHIVETLSPEEMLVLDAFETHVGEEIAVTWLEMLARRCGCPDAARKQWPSTTGVVAYEVGAL